MTNEEISKPKTKEEILKKIDEIEKILDWVSEWESDEFDYEEKFYHNGKVVNIIAYSEPLEAEDNFEKIEKAAFDALDEEGFKVIRQELKPDDRIKLLIEIENSEK